MLFDFQKKKKTSKHLIGIDSEVYILYEDKVLLKTQNKMTRGAIFFSFPFPEWQIRCHFQC